jgi:hypothetical protein
VDANEILRRLLPGFRSTGVQTPRLPAEAIEILFDEYLRRGSASDPHSLLSWTDRAVSLDTALARISQYVLWHNGVEEPPSDEDELAARHNATHGRILICNTDDSTRDGWHWVTILLRL